MLSGGASGTGASAGAPAGCSAPRTSASSPVSYISVTMSQPPIRSPFTNSCGIVGQFERADSSWRMRGSGSTSTAANGLPTALRAATVRAEKPHIGCSGVPFMKRMTSWSRIASEMASRMGFSVVSLMSLRSRFEGQRVDGAADLRAEHRIHPAVLLDPAQIGELRCRYCCTEVIPAAREVLHLHVRARDRSLDPLLQLVGRRHPSQHSGRYPF